MIAQYQAYGFAKNCKVVFVRVLLYPSFRPTRLSRSDVNDSSVVPMNPRESGAGAGIKRHDVFVITQLIG